MDDGIRTAVGLNPMFHIVALYRSMLFGTSIHMTDVVWSVASALVVGLVGIGVFVRYEGHIVRYL
jgi:ABC-type polysaccharide/polyol phosphate export permease